MYKRVLSNLNPKAGIGTVEWHTKEGSDIIEVTSCMPEVNCEEEED